MKRHVNYAFVVLAICLISLAGCAGSDNTTDVTTDTTYSANTTELSDTTAPQAPMDPDTDMVDEDTTDTNISANNQLGNRMNLVILIGQNPNLSTLSELIRASNLVIELESPADYTFFAPTNDAFSALPAGTLDVLKQPVNSSELRNLLQAQILPNRISTEEMKDKMPMKTAQGEEVIVQRSGQTIKVGGATILTKDVKASNGLVHVIDKVLVPPSK